MPAPWLDGLAVVFGHVTSGMEVVETMLQADAPSAGSRGDDSQSLPVADAPSAGSKGDDSQSLPVADAPSA